MEPITTYKDRPVVRDWKQLSALISGRYPEQFKAGTPEYDRAWNVYSGGASGGYLLDQELGGSVWDKARAIDGPLSRCRLYPTSKHTLWLPGFNESSRVTGSRLGGLRGYWKGQKDDATMNASSAKLFRASFTLQDLYVFSEPISRDLLADSPLVEAMLRQSAHLELNYNIVDAMFNGKGDGSPLGVLNAPCSATVARNTGGAIKYQDIEAMWGRLWAFCKRNAVWHCTDSVIDDVDATATANNWPESIYIPAGVYGNPTPMIKGRPVLVVEQTQKLGTAGDLVLADWSQYCLVYKVPAEGAEGPTMELSAGAFIQAEGTRSFDRYFDTDSAVFRWKFRADGMPLWNQLLTLADGSAAQVGPFVYLV